MAIEMTITELFDVGVSFESCVGLGTKSERSRIPKNYSRLNLTEDMIEKITNYPEEINCLIAGEIWCPDLQLNATVLKKFCELNDNFDMSIISTARGVKFLAPILNIEKENFKGPTIVFMDKDFNVLGLFEERPKTVKAFENFEDVKIEYYKGKYLLDTASDFLEILG